MLISPSDIAWSLGRGVSYGCSATMCSAEARWQASSDGDIYHPCDRVAKEAPATVARFFEDQRRFPPAAYAEHAIARREVPTHGGPTLSCVS